MLLPAAPRLTLSAGGDERVVGDHVGAAALQASERGDRWVNMSEASTLKIQLAGLHAMPCRSQPLKRPRPALCSS